MHQWVYFGGVMGMGKLRYNPNKARSKNFLQKFSKKGLTFTKNFGKIILPLVRIGEFDMTREDIEIKLLQAICQIQELSGHPDLEISVNTCPIKDLPDFDSLRGVEATVMLGSLLNCEIKGEVNLFVSENGRSALRIHEIVDRIYALTH